MLTIGEEQVAALAKIQSEKFTDRLAIFMCQEFPDALEVPKIEFKNIIDRQISQAQGYGFELEDQLATYVVTAWYLGEDFDTHFPAAKFMMSASSYNATEKIQWLKEWTLAMFNSLECGD